MGTYINIGNAGFQRARNSEYVDKSMLISVVNKTLFTEHQLLQDTLDGEEEAVARAIDAAIDQIKRRQYPAKVAQYTDNLLLVGINFDRDTKLHTCHIETYTEGR